MSDAAALAHWSPALGATLTTAVVRSRHGLADRAEFGDPALIELLDTHPRESLQAYAPGAAGVSPWPAVDVRDADGRTLLEAVRSGRLWLNVIRADRHHPPLKHLQDRLFEEMRAVVPDVVAGSESSTVLISSADASVPFHLDAGPNVLWHIRGRKRLFLYPPADDAFVSRADREDLFAGVLREFVPYDSAFDDAAQIVDLEPGDVLAWPQNGPHRIENLDGTNVTLSTEFETRRSLRRRRVYCANRFLRRRVRLPIHSVDEAGPVSTLKIAAYGAARALRFDRPGTGPAIDAELELNPTTGTLEPLATPTAAAFS